MTIARFVAAFAGGLRRSDGHPFLSWDRPQGRLPKIVIGSDGRDGWQKLADFAKQELIQQGCDVVDLGVAMTPTVGVMVRKLGAAGGLVLTASHNPQQWNGLKPITRKGHARRRRKRKC